MEPKKVKLIEPESMMMVTRSWGLTVEKVEKCTNSRKFWRSLTYNIVTIVNNTVLHSLNLIRVDLKSSHHKKIKKFLYALEKNAPIC